MSPYKSRSIFPSFRILAAYAILTTFVLFFVFSGFHSQISDGLSRFANGISSKFPDFSKYVELENLSDEQFPLGDERKRVVLVGDIHGRYDELQKLLRKISYDPSADTLISVGDIIAKGPHTGSMQVVRFMSSNNITAVRGNHDEKVIEWRTWLNWIRALPGGNDWLQLTKDKWLAYKERERGESDVEEWVAKQMKEDKPNRKWWNKIPDGWQLFGDHYEIAAELTDDEYKYMVSRPLRIHVPSAHTFIVHAGVLASDPTRDPRDKRQPLATVPKIPDFAESSISDKILRKLQELAILSLVPQNLDPWVTLNMRGVKNGKVTRGKDGTPWSELYNEDMHRCKGFSSRASTHKKKNSLPCQPATVIYGHAASRGLDIKRWTLGLDSGCVYQRRMTALVLGGKYASKHFNEDEEENEEDGVYDIEGKRVKSVIDFGDDGKGKLFSVACN